MKTTKEMIEVMQAFERGEVVEARPLNGGKWVSFVTAAPVWNNGDYDYRIKPREPRVIWVNEYDEMADVVHDSQEVAIRAAAWSAMAPKRTAVKYVEAIE